jgi:hypothetical protein
MSVGVKMRRATPFFGTASLPRTRRPRAVTYAPHQKYTQAMQRYP